MAQYINIFVILGNLECQVTHFYYEGWDNIYIYICVYIKFVINLCITWTWTDEHATNLNMKQSQKFTSYNMRALASWFMSEKSAATWPPLSYKMVEWPAFLLQPSFDFR